MPPPATHRFTLYVLPPGVDDPAERVEGALASLVREGLVTAAGLPGPVPLVEGGFGRLIADRWPAQHFLANGQGGFRVACPRTGESVVPAFNRAITAWRAGGPRTVGCTCGEVHDLAELHYRPTAGFARAALRITEPARAELTPAGEAALVAAWGAAEGAPVRLVGRRG